MVWLAVALFIVVLVVLAFLKAKAATGGAGFPYVAEKPLFTAAERSFLGVLDQAIGSEYRIFGKVRVADLLSVKKGGGRGAFFRINAKHFDFVLCRPADLRPICVIELNDQSHERVARKGRDEFLTRACEAAGLPLIWYPAQRGYAVADVLARIREALPSQQDAASVIAAAKSSLPEGTANPLPNQEAAESLAPSCPRCTNPMVKRVIKSGVKQGTEFWGCSKFPACRGMVTI